MRHTHRNAKTGCCQSHFQARVRAQVEWLLTQSLGLQTSGYKCTTAILLNILYWAASRCASLTAACDNHHNGPGNQAVRDALRHCLPKYTAVLERWFNQALVSELPARLRRKPHRIAIDWHQIPYHGQPLKNASEIRRGQPHSGTTTFHVYATACIVEHGQRFTLALTRVLLKESCVKVLERLVCQLQSQQCRIQVLLLDRQFYSSYVINWLQQQQLPYVIPVSQRGRISKSTAPLRGVRALLKSRPGWSSHTLRAQGICVTFGVCICWKMIRRSRDRTRHRKVLLYACGGVQGGPHEICQLYRRRFGIESSYRQLKQHRIRTSSRDPLFRLLFVGLALLLRNLWACFHLTALASPPGDPDSVHLSRLRLRTFVELLILQPLPNTRSTAQTGNY